MGTATKPRERCRLLATDRSAGSCRAGEVEVPETILADPKHPAQRRLGCHGGELGGRAGRDQVRRGPVEADGEPLEAVRGRDRLLPRPHHVAEHAAAAVRLEGPAGHGSFVEHGAIFGPYLKRDARLLGVERAGGNERGVGEKLSARSLRLHHEAVHREEVVAAGPVGGLLTQRGAGPTHTYARFAGVAGIARAAVGKRRGPAAR